MQFHGKQPRTDMRVKLKGAALCFGQNPEASVE